MSIADIVIIILTFYRICLSTYLSICLSSIIYCSLQYLRPLLPRTLQPVPSLGALVRNGKWLTWEYYSYFIESEVNGMEKFVAWRPLPGISYYSVESSTITMCWNWGITNIYSFTETLDEWLPDISICDFFSNFVSCIFRAFCFT